MQTNYTADQCIRLQLTRQNVDVIVSVGLSEHLHGFRYFGDKGLFILFILITFFISK